jgi:hypothetical protein
MTMAVLGRDLRSILPLDTSDFSFNLNFLSSGPDAGIDDEGHATIPPNPPPSPIESKQFRKATAMEREARQFRNPP